jgi:hypothetical protein
MMNRISIHLSRSKADVKTVQQYLDAADGDATVALANARADVAAREKQNAAARRFRRAMEPLVGALDIDAELDEDTLAATARAAAERFTAQKDAAEQLKSTAEQVKQGAAAIKAMEALGVTADFEAAVEGLTARLAAAGEADKLKRQIALTSAASDLGFDADKLTRILRDEAAAPVKRKVKGADGTEAEQWVIPGDGEAFTVLTDHADVAAFGSALKRTSAVTETQDSGARFITQKPSSDAAKPQMGTPLPPELGRI